MRLLHAARLGLAADREEERRDVEDRALRVRLHDHRTDDGERALVDLVVASITTSIGMLQLPPVTISTPLKILLFVMVDGWNLLAGSLLKSFS